MGASRLAAVPINHFIAEMAAFPLASEHALRLATTQLDPNLGQGTAELWRGTERQILGASPAFSVDEMVAIRDSLWFGTGGERVPLHDYLRRLAQAFLETRGSIAIPTLPKAPGGPPAGRESEPPAVWARLTWRWMSFALPPDLLFAALGTDETCPERVDLLTPLLDRQLTDKPYAEIHLHMGAALEFPLLWVAALRAIASTDTKSSAFQSPGAILDEGRALAPWVLRAAIARYVLAAYLRWGRGVESDFRSFVNTRVTTRVNKHAGPALLSSLAVCLGDLWRGQLTNAEPTFPSLQSLYVHLLGGGYIARSLPSSFAECQEADPIAVFIPSANYGKVSSEIRFMMAGLKYLESRSENKTAGNDRLFASIFWQVVRIRGLLYRHMVQRPLTPGLQWFIRFYDRLDAGNRPLSRKLFVESAAKLAGIEKGGLQSLELRTAPKYPISQLH